MDRRPRVNEIGTLSGHTHMLTGTATDHCCCEGMGDGGGDGGGGGGMSFAEPADFPSLIAATQQSQAC